MGGGLCKFCVFIRLGKKNFLEYVFFCTCICISIYIRIYWLNELGYVIFLVFYKVGKIGKKIVIIGLDKL